MTRLSLLKLAITRISIKVSMRRAMTTRKAIFFLSSMQHQCILLRFWFYIIPSFPNFIPDFITSYFVTTNSSTCSFTFLKAGMNSSVLTHRVITCYCDTFIFYTCIFYTITTTTKIIIGNKLKFIRWNQNSEQPVYLWLRLNCQMLM